MEKLNDEKIENDYGFIKTSLEEVRKFRNHTENSDVVHITELPTQKII